MYLCVCVLVSKKAVLPPATIFLSSPHLKTRLLPAHEEEESFGIAAVKLTGEETMEWGNSNARKNQEKTKTLRESNVQEVGGCVVSNISIVGMEVVCCSGMSLGKAREGL